MAVIDNTLFTQTAGSASTPLGDTTYNHPTQHQNVDNELNSIEDTIVQGYVREAATVTYVSSTSFTVSGDVTAIYTNGRIVRFSDGTTGIVSSSSYSSPNTTVTMLTGTVPSNLSYVDIAIQAKGQTAGLSSRVLGDNNIPVVSQKDSGGTARDVAKIDSSDVATFGNTTTTTKIKAGSNTTNGHTVPNVADDTFALLSSTSQNIKLPTPFSTATDGATVTFDLSQSRNWIVTLGGNRTLALSNVVTGMVFMITTKQDGTGSRTVTWWSGISWAGGTAPTLTTTANKADTFGFICTDSNTYYGYVVGQNL